MAIVVPTWMIEDRIKTDAVNGEAGVMCGDNFLADVVEPFRSREIFGSSFRDEDRPVVAVPNFLQNFVKGSVPRIRSRKRRFGIVDPFVLHVEIYTDHVQVFRPSA